MTKVAISEEYLTDIADSIREKLDTQETYKVSEMSEAIDSIETGGSGGLDWTALGYDEQPQKITDDYNYGVSIKNNWDATQTDLSNKLKDNQNLVYMPSVDCSNATKAEYMFKTCSKLQIIGKLTFSNKMTSLREMFKSCESLVELDLSGFNTSNVYSFRNMFDGCNSIKELDLSGFDTSSMTQAQAMFNTMKVVEKIDVRTFEFSKLSSSYSSNIFSSDNTLFPPNCLIIVKNATEKTWMTTKFSFLTNVKTVDEYNAM